MRKGINILLILILCFVVPLAYGQDEEIGELKEFISPVLPETPDEVMPPEEKPRVFTPPALPETPDEVAPSEDKTEEFTPPTLPETPDEIPSPKDKAKEFTPPALPETPDEAAPSKDESKEFTPPALPETPDEVTPPKDKSEEFTPPVLPETSDEVTPPEVKPKEFIPPVLPKTAYSPPKHAFYMFDGQWLPDIEPIKIGPNNYKTQQNLRPIDKGLEGVQGYTKINTTAVTGYPDLSHGYHFIKDQPQESHVMVWAKTSDATATGLYKNDTAIPDQGQFSGVAIIHEDSAVSLEGRMSNAPDGNMAYCNTKVNKIWSGDEMRVASFMTSDSAATDTLTNPRDYTIQVNNKLDDGENVAVIGGGNDSPYTKLLLNFDGLDGSQTFTDSNSGSTAGAHTISVDTTAALDTDQKKFGTAAGYFDGGTSIYVADHVDWHMSNGDGAVTDFTIDFWTKTPVGTTTRDAFFCQTDNAGEMVGLFHAQNAGLYLYVRGPPGGEEILQVDWIPTFGLWYHLGITRKDNLWTLWVSGVSKATMTNGYFWPNLDNPLVIGSFTDTAVTHYHTGWIDEFRWSKGLARWTSNFEPPVRKYDTGSAIFVIGSPRPASGASIYVKSGNQVSGQTVTVREYNGSSWTTISATGTTEPTNGLARSGKIPWSSTVDTSKPKYLENKLFYWYEFALPDGEATIYHVTLDCPFQDITDIWDSVYRQPIQFQVNRSANWEDYTGEVNLESSDLYPIGAQMGGLTSSDHAIIMFDERMQAVFFDVLSGNTVSIPAGVSTYYWNSSGWVLNHSQFDLTDTGMTPLNRSGAVSWQPPTQDEEFKQAIFGVEGYAYKFVWNGTLNSTDEPESTLIDVVYGVPAPLRVKPFKFPVEFKKRLLLCGYTEGNQGNRIDFSLTNAPNVWNGTETSDNGNNPIWVGGNEDLTAAIQIYNRYGNNLYTNLVCFKKNSMFVLLGDGPTGDNKFQVLPVSDTIGCPAPLTLAGMELGYEVFEGELTANIIMWLSYAGVKGFDGAKPFPIKGIDSYFDPAESKCINYDYISVARGWFDPTYNEYNLLIPSGSGQTTNNVWLVYNLLEKKWYEKVPGIASMPQFGFQVADTDGAKYIYGGVTTGYLMRLENGTDWDSVTGVMQVVETGDFYPTNDPWHITRLRRLKLDAKKITESTPVTVTHYADTATSGTSVMSLSLSSGSNDITRKTEPCNLLGRQHRMKFEAVTNTTTKGFRPIGWGHQHWIEREDE